MKKLFVFTLNLLLVVGVATSAYAYSLVGSISGGDGGGLKATGPWDSANTILTWEITQVPDTPYWRYHYTFTVLEKDISHVTVEVSGNFTEQNIFEGTTPGYDLATYSDNDGNSNPGLVDELYGLKWDMTSDTLFYEWFIVTDRAPMDGSFYAKDGTDGDVWVYAYGKGNVTVPDTQTTIPEPSTVLLLGAGLLGLLGFGRKLKK